LSDFTRWLSGVVDRRNIVDRNIISELKEKIDNAFIKGKGCKLSSDEIKAMSLSCMISGAIAQEAAIKD
jgi:hypothetical protein